MATYEFTRPAPFGAIAIYRAVEGVQSGINALIAWNDARQTRKVLNTLSDEVLADIGLLRGTITDI